MDNNNSPSGLGGKISVSEAAELTANWRTYVTTSGQAFTTRGFLIPITSVKDLIDQNQDADGVRVYLGLSDATDPNSGKIVLVPVVDGNDVLFIPGSGEDRDDEDDSNLYDRTSPCPPSCGVRNELNP